MKPISKSKLQSKLVVVSRERLRDGWKDTILGTISCYIEEKKTWSKSNNGYDLVGSHLVIYDDKDITLKNGDKIIVDSVEYIVYDMTIYKPGNKYHHTELVVK
jgi:hypothetical protein